MTDQWRPPTWGEPEFVPEAQVADTTGMVARQAVEAQRLNRGFALGYGLVGAAAGAALGTALGVLALREDVGGVGGFIAGLMTGGGSLLCGLAATVAAYAAVISARGRVGDPGYTSGPVAESAGAATPASEDREGYETVSLDDLLSPYEFELVSLDEAELLPDVEVGHDVSFLEVEIPRLPDSTGYLRLLSRDDLHADFMIDLDRNLLLPDDEVELDRRRPHAAEH